MKTTTTLLFAAAILCWSCNNEAKDSVEQADSANEAKMDSATDGAGQTAIVADKETADFLVDAANGGMTEVKLGELAQQKATNQKVKDFGSMMVHDHSAVNDEVKALASRRNVTLPTAVSDEKQKDIDNLSKKSGADFDKSYCKTMEDAHQATIDRFKSAADKVNDAEVKTFINNTIPKVQHHLDSIKAIRKSMK
jgi:putative membrane protein